MRRELRQEIREVATWLVHGNSKGAERKDLSPDAVAWLKHPMERQDVEITIQV